MIGILYINDKDAWATWKVGLLKGSYSNLLLPAPQKEFSSNNLRNQDGKQVFVSNPRIDERMVQLMFGIDCSSYDDYLLKYESFLTELRKGVILLRVPRLKTVYKLILISFIELNVGSKLQNGTISVRFNEPNPKDRISL